MTFPASPASPADVTASPYVNEWTEYYMTPLEAMVAATADAIARPFAAIDDRDGRLFRFTTALARREWLRTVSGARPYFD